jgi:hypothetical protein
MLHPQKMYLVSKKKKCIRSTGVVIWKRHDMHYLLYFLYSKLNGSWQTCLVERCFIINYLSSPTPSPSPLFAMLHGSLLQHDLPAYIYFNILYRCFLPGWERISSFLFCMIFYFRSAGISKWKKKKEIQICMFALKTVCLLRIKSTCLYLCNVIHYMLGIWIWIGIFFIMNCLLCLVYVVIAWFLSNCFVYCFVCIAFCCYNSNWYAHYNFFQTEIERIYYYYLFIILFWFIIFFCD